MDDPVIAVSALQVAMPHAPKDWLEALVAEAPKWGIDTVNEMASLAAQLALESTEFTRLEELLNYSAERLIAVWPKRFPTIEAAVLYAHSPASLANHVYATRLGNGDEASGDGWLFRGRGPIQITGRRNYAKCAVALGEPLIQKPELLLTPVIGIRSACWFWKVNNLDLYDDDLEAREETRLINGGEHGLKQRQAYLDKILAAARGV
jgi:putative chitinase